MYFLLMIPQSMEESCSITSRGKANLIKIAAAFMLPNCFVPWNICTGSMSSIGKRTLDAHRCIHITKFSVT